MFEQHIMIFAAIGILGLIIIILGFKFSDKTRKVVETTGAIIFHVGVFGILYNKVSLNLFISLVALVISLFILIDPLKISTHLNAKIYRLVGYLVLFTAVAFSLDYFSGFPVWLWAIPLVIYLSPYLISPLKKHLKIVLALAWLVVFSYVGLIGYVIYTKYTPEAKSELVTKYFPQLHISKYQNKTTTQPDVPVKTQTQPDKTQPDQTKTTQTPDTTKPTTTTATTKVQTKVTAKTTPPVTTKKPTPTKIEGPYLKSIQQADKKFLALQNKYKSLKKTNIELTKENQDLKKKLNELQSGNNKGRVETF